VVQDACGCRPCPCRCWLDQLHTTCRRHQPIPHLVVTSSAICSIS